MSHRAGRLTGPRRERRQSPERTDTDSYADASLTDLLPGAPAMQVQRFSKL
jgi:hypothetical protein